MSIAIDLVGERRVDSSDNSNSKPRVNILISRITHGENGFEILLACGQPYQAWVTPPISLLSDSEALKEVKKLLSSAG
jgi:hypothetical protein